jgi:hypothetical protein
MLSARAVLSLPLCCAFFLLVSVAGEAGAIPISFNAFTYDSGAPVSVAADGSTATISESAELAVVFLSNLPGLGDPEVIVAAPGSLLVVDYQFDEPEGNDDSFHVALLDGTSGDSLGDAYEFSTSSSGSGSVQFDLSSLVGTTLGLQFGLAAELNDMQYSSSVALSNLHTVPAPEALTLVLTGLAGLALGRAYRGVLQR